LADTKLVIPAKAGIQGKGQWSLSLSRLAELADTKLVIPAKAGIQGKWSLDSGFRRNDGSGARTVGYLSNAR
jgi:hypothetical protein